MRRADDAVRALRASLSRRQPSYEGSHYKYSGFVIDPCAVQERVPLWVGGRTARSLRRAVEFGDGWAPFGLDSDALGKILSRARDTEAWERREVPLELIFFPEPALEPDVDPGRVGDVIGRYSELGATMLNLRMVSRSLPHCLEQLEAFVAAAGTTSGAGSTTSGAGSTASRAGSTASGAGSTASAGAGSDAGS